MSDNIYTTYEPDNFLKKGYLTIFLEIIIELNKSKWLIYQLFKREFFTLYKQSLMGFIWTIILPLISIILFILLYHSGILIIGDIQVPYPLYALIGMSFWQVFSRGLIASSNALVNAGPMILKINFSKKSLVLASAGQAIISFLIQFILGLILFIYYRIIPHFGVILIPVLIIPILLFTLGAGFILSLINGIVRDIGNMLSIGVTFLMFLTPVLFVKPKTGLLALMTNYNPIYFLISLPRELILKGSTSEWKGFFISTIFSIILFIFSIFIFHLTEKRVAERI